MEPQQNNNNSAVVINKAPSPEQVAQSQIPTAMSQQPKQQKAAAPVEDVIEPVTHKKQEVQKEVELTPETGVDFSDDPKKESEDDQYTRLLKEYQEESQDSKVTNMDKALFGVPLSREEELENFKLKTVIANSGNLDAVFRDLRSDYFTATSSQEALTPNYDLNLKALEKCPKGTEFSHTVNGMGDAPASIFKKYRDQGDNVELSGAEGLLAFTSLTGGVRRARLYNTGIYLSFRNIPLINLHQFFNEFNEQDYEFGKQFGAFYYMFADLYIRKYIIEHLLPLALCGSNYAHWRDMDRLLGVVSVQDFDVIMWTLGVMMHPNGIDVGFVCANDQCRHVEQQHADLSKLRLNNLNLINDDMLEFLKNKSSWIYDEDLVKYREMSRFNKKIEFSYMMGDTERKWRINMKQATMRDYIQVGDDYITELRKNCDPKSRQDVNMYMMYNSNRALKPWIDSVELIVDDPDSGKEKTFILKNDNSAENNQAIFMLLDEFQANSSDFSKLVEDYILDTRITHICFYMPKCPKCGKEPTTSYRGYLPYDPMRSFFILARTKLLQGASRRDSESTSTDTKNS